MEDHGTYLVRLEVPYYSETVSIVTLLITLGTKSHHPLSRGCNMGVSENRGP